MYVVYNFSKAWDVFFFFLRIKSRFYDVKVISKLVENIKGFEINCSGIIANYVRVINCLEMQILLVRFESLDNQWFKMRTFFWIGIVDWRDQYNESLIFANVSSRFLLHITYKSSLKIINCYELRVILLNNMHRVIIIKSYV